MEIQNIEQKYVIPAMFKEVYGKIENGSSSWASLAAPSGKLYPWDVNSTYIKNPPYFSDLQKVIKIIYNLCIYFYARKLFYFHLIYSLY